MKRCTILIIGLLFPIMACGSETVSEPPISEYDFELPVAYEPYLLPQIVETFDDYEMTKEKVRYPFSARVFVPGYAQIYKGQIGKGVGFIVGEVAFIGGIVASECLRASYVSKMNGTHNLNQRQIYADNAHTCELSRNISIAGAAALYVWNILDGILAKGRPKVQIGEANLRFAPYAAPDASGVALSLTF